MVEPNKKMKVIPSDEMETQNDCKYNLNTSLTSLRITEPTSEMNQSYDADNKEPSNIPAKLLTIPIRTLPVRNVPEKIIICLDTGIDAEYTAFKIGDGRPYTPLYMLKRVAELFVQNKNLIDPRHEYALITIDATAVKWIKEFSNNPNNIISGLNQIGSTESVGEKFDLSNVLDAVWQNVTIPKPMNPLYLPPPYIVRLILLYSRSSCTFVDRKNYEELLNHPYFTVDVIFTHESIPDIKYLQAFDCLQKLDEKVYSHEYCVGRNVTMLHDSMAKLLAHPLQRPVQNMASYEINQEAQTSCRKVEKEEE